MRAVTAAQTFPGSVHEAESVWYDTGRWAGFVDGFDQLERVEEGWPAVGARVAWRSGPAGRGHVVERVVAYEPLAGQTVELEDDSIRGRQQVAFTPDDGDVAVELVLEYELKQRSPLTGLIDRLFIRPAIRSSLQATLRKFGVELQAARAADLG
jgi:hypothetical protein